MAVEESLRQTFYRALYQLLHMYALRGENCPVGLPPADIWTMPKRFRLMHWKALPVPKYRLKFLPAARKEWDQIDGNIQLQFLKVPAA
jgi:hypothetical protein